MHSFLFFSRSPPPPTSTLFPYTTLFRSRWPHLRTVGGRPLARRSAGLRHRRHARRRPRRGRSHARSEEHTSELQSPDHLVCRLLLEKKKTKTQAYNTLNSTQTVARSSRT